MKIKVKTLMEKYSVQFEKIRQVMADADKAYKALPAEQRLIHSKRTRASYIADFFRSFVLKHLLDDPDIRIPPGGSLRIIIKDECQLTFKKLNDNLKPSYLPKWFLKHSSSSKFLGDMPEPTTNLVAGYRWEAMEQSHLYLVQPIGDGIQWSGEFSEPEATEQPTESICNQPAEVSRKVFPKGQPNKPESV